MAGHIAKSKPWWTVWLLIWAVMYLVVILVYPSEPSIWFGWVPSSVIITFGLMVVSLILGYVFAKQRFNL
ncbi:MAG: hypothetical protein AB1896_12915 [Thermodesulfobacteriota bacterium]